jgi:threonyl-tRNA synthetase
VRCLLVHCRSFSYRLDHATPVAEPGVEGSGESFADALVAFTAIEPDDSSQVTRAARAIRRQAGRADAAIIVLNPFVHLTATPARPDEAVAVGRRLLARLRDSAAIPVEYTSFGWSKSFQLDALGHHDSQVFREFRAG